MSLSFRIDVLNLLGFKFRPYIQEFVTMFNIGWQGEEGGKRILRFELIKSSDFRSKGRGARKNVVPL